MSMSSLSFSLRMVAGESDLHDVAALRAVAYGHHVPALRTTLDKPDALDHLPGTVVLLCRDKVSGEAVGTARIQRNHPAPLQIEASVTLPPVIAALPRAEITRLAIRAGADRLVRPMLVKACYLYAVASQIRTLVIGARSPALIRVYRGLGFDDVFGPGEMRPLAHAGGLPHQVLAFDVVSAERHWHGASHGLYSFMVETWHPDLQLLAAPEPQGPPAWLAASSAGAAPHPPVRAPAAPV